MQLSKFLPKKFSSRLFLVTLAAGLVPVVIFSILIDIYGGRIEKEITRTIEKGYGQDTARSAGLLRKLGEASVYGKVRDIAEQLDTVIQSVPWMTLSDLQRDAKFRDLAVQTIGRTGYTFVFDPDRAMVRFHRDLRLENKGLSHVSRRLPELEAILERSLKGPGAAYGYYRLPAGDGGIMKRFICIIPLRNATADRVRLFLAATVNEDDFLDPMKKAEADHNKTKQFLVQASKNVIESFRHVGLIWMGLGILTVSIIALAMGTYLSRAVTRLRQATARVNRGDLSTPVKPCGSGEVATLIEDFNTMVDRLAATTVSKELLQASEARLREVNSELRREIAGRERMEEELLKARKLESLNVLAGGIAHDFNNLLAVILGNISFGRMFLTEESKVSDRLAEAERACMRGKDLTYQLLAFARGSEPLRRVVDAAPLIEDCVRSCIGESRLSVSFSFAGDLPGLRVDEGQVRQVIERIVKNADEAMGEGGVLEVGAEGVALGADNPLALKQGKYVHIHVRDEGPGIDSGDLRRIFDPYFTKKQMGQEKGTGLSLSICYSIVKDHGGSITAESERGKGSTFHIYLPAAGEKRPAEALPATPGPDLGKKKRGPGEKGRVLFMDDDQGVRDVVVEMLLHLGYQVRFAKEGSEAIEHYREAVRSGHPFDVVVADLTVNEGMGGKELIKALHNIDPRVRAVISSGYSNDPALRDFREHGFSAFVAKPYKIEELCSVLDTIMQEERR